jgi:outer membrane receptor protein involved in Fe transport
MIAYDINDAWRITAEGRYADETLDQHSIIQNLDGPVIEDVNRSASFDSFNPRVTLDWQATDNNMLYLLYAEGNKPGGFNNTFAQEAGYPVYDEETVDSIEFGSKNYFLDGQMTANFAFYYNQIEGYQMTQNITSGVNASSATVNAGDADVKGMEAELVIRPAVAEGFTIMLNYAYNDSSFTRGVDENQGVLNDVLDDGLNNCSLGDQFPDVPRCQAAFGSIIGKSIPRSARNQFFLDLDYRRPLGDTQWEWFTGVNYQYESSKFAQVHNLAKTGESELVNARLGVQNDRWMFQLWANNLLDDDSVVSIRRYAMPTGFTRNFALSPRRPTYYGLTATLNF